jgi:hypothetical protein
MFGLDAVWFSFIIAEVAAISIIAPWLIIDLRKVFKGWEEEKVESASLLLARDK